MTPPNATPTRADVLREFRTYYQSDLIYDMADEIVRLRAQRDAMIRRVEALPKYAHPLKPDRMVMLDAVLAALRERGDA